MSSILTASRLRTYRDCARKHDLMYRQGWRPVRVDENLRFGSLIHLGLEAWWIWHQIAQGIPQSILDSSVTPDALTAALEAVSGKAEDDFEQARVEELLRGYHDRWLGELAEWEVIGVELFFQAAQLNPETMAPSRTWRLAGKLDVLLRHQGTGRVCVVEHKTTSEDIDSDADHYWQKLAIDHQISIYVIGAESLGYKVDDTLYDVIRKPGIRQAAVPLTDEQGVRIVHDAEGQRVRTKDGKKWRETSDTAQGYVLQTRPETAEEFRTRLRTLIEAKPAATFQRRLIPRMNAQLQDFMFDAWQLGKQIREAELAQRAPRNPEACFRYGGQCPFWDVCSGGHELEGSPYFRRIANVHPELAELEPEPKEDATNVYGSPAA